MKTIIILFIASAATVCAGPSSSIEEPRGPLTLRQGLALALTHNPELAAIDHDLRIADARLLQSKLRPNPEAQFTSENFAGTGSYSDARRSENTLLLGQLLELGGKRRARMREARFGRELAGFDYETRKRAVFLQTSRHFIDVLAGQRRVGIAEEIVRLANDFIPAVEKRLKAGRASDLEKTRFDIAIASGRIELEQAKHEVMAARQRLAAQWRATRPRFTSVVGNLDATPEIASFDALATRLASNPRLARFGAEVARREAALAREKAAAVPDVTLSAGARQLNETNDATAIIGFSVPLPLWNRNQGNVRAAREQIDRAGAERAAVAATLMTELSDAYHDLSRTRATIDLLRTEILPNAEGALAATAEGYESGRFSYLDVLETRRNIGAARLQYLDALASYHKAFHAVESLTAAPQP